MQMNLVKFYTLVILSLNHILFSSSVIGFLAAISNYVQDQ